MTISTTGAGERNLYVSYISEVPIWKTTYRIVLPSKAEKRPLLQGWAIVEHRGRGLDSVNSRWWPGGRTLLFNNSRSPLWKASGGATSGERATLAADACRHSHARKRRLSGVVSDPAGAAVPGANVRLLDEKTRDRATTTESTGQYTFSGVSAGNYRVEVERLGFQKNVIAGLNVSPGENQFNTQLRLGSSTQLWRWRQTP